MENLNIFLLGNGFDLHHKFPTAYIDFLYTIKFLVDHYDNSMDTVAKVFGDKRLNEKCKNIHNSYIEYEGFYKEILLDNSVINQLIKTAENNVWFKYLSTAVKRELTWIDFEREIAKVMVAFEKFFNYDDLKFDPLNHPKDPEAAYIISCFDFFYKQAPSQRSDTPSRFKIVKEDYSIEKLIGSEIFAINKQEIIKDLYSSLRDLANMLQTYLSVFINNLISEIKNMGFSMKNPTYPEMDKVFSFNYTNTIEELYASKENVYHIHGNINDNIVLGVNSDKYDEIENIDTLFIQFKKYYQRVFYKTDVRYLKATNLIQDNKVRFAKAREEIALYVIGHSLDQTDKDIIQEIFCVADKIIILYHEEKVVGDYISNLVSLYGKTGFDSLRVQKKIEFLPHEPFEKYNA